MISDTHPEIQEAQLRLLAEKTCAERFELLASLTDSAVLLAKRAISRANRGLNSRDQDLLFIQVHYGRRMADAVRDYREERGL